MFKLTILCDFESFCIDGLSLMYYNTAKWGDIMIALEYKFENLRRNTESSYIFQTVKNRELSDIYHSHDFYEWVIVVEGSCTQIINEKNVHMDKSSCLLMCPGDRHKYVSQSDDVNIISVSVEKEEFDRFATAFGFEKDKNCFLTALNTNSFSAVLGFYHSNCEAEYKLLLANLIKISIDAFTETDGVPALLKFAVNQMMKPENLKVGIKRFTELSGYSKTHLSRLMIKHYGVTLHQFVFNTRLESAYNLLVLTKINTEELSESLGYASFSHFNKIFKSKYGITPAALRKSHSIWTI